MKLSRGIRGGGGGNGERRNGSEQKAHFDFQHNSFCGENSVSTRGLQTLNCRDRTDLRFLCGVGAKGKGARGGTF